MPQQQIRERMFAIARGEYKPKASDPKIWFTPENLARMKAAPRFFNQEEWNALASYKGQVVSGDPEGLVPDDLEADDNE